MSFPSPLRPYGKGEKESGDTGRPGAGENSLDNRDLLHTLPLPFARGLPPTCAAPLFRTMLLLPLVTLAQTTTPPPQQGIGSMLIPFLCIGVIFYFLILRPQKQQQKKLSEMVAALKTGDKVVTTGGIHGIIANVKDGTTLLLKVDDGCRIEVDKTAVATIKKE